MENSETELADATYAANVARVLLGSFPNQPHDPATFLKQLTIACTGKPKAMLRAMVDPRDGFLAHEKFPTIAALNEWFEKQAARDADQAGHRACAYHRPFLPAPEHELEPQEVRDAAVERWRGVKAGQVIEQTASKMLDWSRTQQPDTEETRAALLETQLMKGEAKA